MNSKFLFVATVAVSLLSTLAMADEARTAAGAPLTRAQVSAEAAQAAANGTLQRTDYDADKRTFATAAATLSNAEVSADMAAAKASRKGLLGPDRNNSYNPFGTQINARSTLARAAVKVDVRNAAALGTLPATDYDDAALVARRVSAHAASVSVAQRLKALVARG